MVDPKSDLVGYLRANVDPSAIPVPFTNADDIVFADYDGGAGPFPQVAVVSKDPVVPGGGQTQATGIDPTGAGPVQDVIYLVQVDCWGGPDDADVYANNGSHPDVVANELGEEIAATCRVGSVGAPDGYEWMFAEPPTEADDTDQSPTEHRDIVTVRMKVTYAP
ncbi:hypothetical protein [Halosimplex sp. J119]